MLTSQAACDLMFPMNSTIFFFRETSMTLFTVTSSAGTFLTFQNLRAAKKFAASLNKPCFGEVIVWRGQPGGMRA